MPDYFSAGRLHEGETEKPTFYLKQGTGDGTAVPLADISTAVLTVEDSTGAVINGRAAQNVKNANNVTIHATSGLVTWAMQVADSTVTGDAGAVKVDAHFTFTLTDGQVRHVHLQYTVIQGQDP
jgi:hypothetical protein